MEEVEQKKRREARAAETLAALGTSFLKSHGPQDGMSKFSAGEDFFSKDKIIGIYFSGHFCPPCRAFTPVLREKVAAYKSEGKNLDIVFVSSDGSNDEFESYFKNEMNGFYAIPFADARKNKLASLYSVMSIPTLILINGEGELITNNGRTAMTNDVYPFANTPSSDSSLSGFNLQTMIFIIIVAAVLRYLFRFELRSALLIAVGLSIVLRLV